MIYEDVVHALEAARASIRCAELAALLARLGFEVRDGNRAGHKVYVHHRLPGFFSGSYNCGHGKNPEIKPAYIGKVLRVLRQYESELKSLEKKP
ncbi:MAG: type II toxin-antitoxin system HicA family toxin [Gammaproteobacteria bacterium]